MKKLIPVLLGILVLASATAEAREPFKFTIAYTIRLQGPSEGIPASRALASAAESKILQKLAAGMLRSDFGVSVDHACGVEYARVDFNIERAPDPRGYNVVWKNRVTPPRDAFPGRDELRHCQAVQAKRSLDPNVELGVTSAPERAGREESPTKHSKAWLRDHEGCAEPVVEVPVCSASGSAH